ncbi:hypothetical protein GCM10020369_44690 [Cryptosporangium minutisporangium]|uniref:Uncharacterized protein n=1 Tax=Cryptosporangium minutisporangium TaxID=113569 RepID=A0ABP6T2Y2_9ACTN
MNHSTPPFARFLSRHRPDGWAFRTEALRGLGTVSAVAPSGQALARARRPGPGGVRSMNTVSAALADVPAATAYLILATAVLAESVLLVGDAAPQRRPAPDRPVPPHQPAAGRRGPRPHRPTHRP